MTYQVSLSDTAFKGLVSQGQTHKYINDDPRMHTARGLGTFLCALLDANPTSDDWEDTRPGIDPETKLEMLENGHLGSWSENESRLVHGLNIPPQYQAHASSLARQLGVIRDTTSEDVYKTFSWRRVTKQGALISEFWEAVGLSYLTPINAPQPRKGSKFRRKPFELDF